MVDPRRGAREYRGALLFSVVAKSNASFLTNNAFARLAALYATAKTSFITA